ncbi:MAG: HD domain-containing protein [Atribacterota bacterium]|nr:HD domain-containing protein [Atribacterota bacterium]MDD4895345.1 HD domain-containing protein [Atribacterota bacterium]MDD5637478.1 HD domain-containing protein [Atribacterota bacterium]
MNNKKRIVDLDLGDVVKQVFYIKEAEFRLRRDGKTVDGFLRISDSSGEIEAIYWDISDKELSQIENMQFAQIAGQVIKKKSDGQIQMSIKSLESAPESSLEDFIPATPLNVEELMQEIDHKISSIKHQYLKALLLSFFDDLILRGKFKKTPAAKKLHQAYKGGLAEHTVNVSRICETICQIYPQVNRDFLVSAALLHDIGKVEEYQLNGVIEYTDKGKLIGHIIMGTEMVEEKIKQIKDFPEDLAVMFKHTILSHHGKFEFGSPKLPSILPAIALFYADDTDAKINGLIGLKEQNKNVDKKWSDWVWWLDRSIYLAEQVIMEDSSKNFEE